MALRRIIGTTARCNAGLSTNPDNGEVAYTAGAAIVVYCPATNEQLAYLTTPNSRPIACLAFAPDGKYIAAGEAGRNPSVVVWDVKRQKVVSEMRGHTLSVADIAWSHSLKYLASVGCEPDGAINIWDWRDGKIVASSPVSAHVCSVQAKNENTFITSGHRHVKFWSLRRPADT
eukprot:COSAG05_NODE_10656_length_553_cov_1.473568_1_plen_173_part_10